MEFGDSGLRFELRAWSTSLIHRRGLLTSNLNFGIYQAFSEHGIEIPYPRRDIHILRPSGRVSNRRTRTSNSGSEANPIFTSGGLT